MERPMVKQLRLRESLTDIVGTFGLLILLAALVVGFTIAKPHEFLSQTNITSILGDQAVPGILALAAVLPLTAGEFDLSIGASMGFCAIVIASILPLGVSTPLAALLVVALGLLIGCVNSFLIVRLKVNAFIATLGIATVLSGGNMWVSQGAVLFQGIPDDLTNFGHARVMSLAPGVWVFLALAVFFWYVFERTPYGRYLRATGLGREAARLSGVQTDRYLASTFIIAGGLNGLAAVLNVARTGSAIPSSGPEFLLPAYAAAFLGATTILRGYFNIAGTVVGVVVLALGVNGLALMGAPFWVSPIFNGAALLIAVSVAAVAERRRRGSER
jgi:ribose transport system permease protein